MELLHYGTPRHSGRYPWGSGDNPYQSIGGVHGAFLSEVTSLEKQGLTQKQIASNLGITQSELRARKSAAKNALKAEEEAFAMRLKEKGYSNTQIGERLGGKSESYVRTLLKPSEERSKRSIDVAVESLKEQLKKHDIIDVGEGVEQYLADGISREKMKVVLKTLEAEGYVIVNDVRIKQVGTDNYTTVMALAKPGMTKEDVYKNRLDIASVATRESYVESVKDPNRILPPTSVSSKRIKVVYDEDGGSEADGLIEVRPGVDDLRMGGARYAQVRIAVDNTHYMKGMAVYSDNLPDGVDIQFHTNKKRGTPLTATDPNTSTVLKKMSKDADNPFEANISRQLEYKDKNGKSKLSALNIIYQEGDWGQWQNRLSSQFVSKQNPSFIKKQLSKVTDKAQADYDEIMSLTNPAVKKRLLMAFADECDKQASHLHAAGLPRQLTQAIIPIKSLKDSEVYAPNFRHGEKVVLVRFPHAGRFEIPELTVNNKNQEAQKYISSSPLDAVGINSRVAAKLSGADYDGDFVVVLPNNNGKIKTAQPLKQLKNFDPKQAYPYYQGMKVLPKSEIALQMGSVSNLITDMTLKGATTSEIARAVKHSMVVIDAHKHKLDYTRSFEENGIAALKEKYQGAKNAGASTLISKASSEVYVNQRKLRSSKNGGPIDKKTGKLVYEETGKVYIKNGKPYKKQSKVTRMSLVDDAHELSSGTVVESLYADHANSLKSMANSARRSYLKQPSVKQSAAARRIYSKEVAALDAKLKDVLKNDPLERQAQRIANKTYSQLTKNNPEMDKAARKKMKARVIAQARIESGAKKPTIKITETEWEAIQAGAVSNTRLNKIMGYADLDTLKQLATPRTEKTVTAAKEARIKALLSAGKTQAEVAEALGVSVSTVNKLGLG